MTSRKEKIGLRNVSAIQRLRFMPGRAGAYRQGSKEAQPAGYPRRLFQVSY